MPDELMLCPFCQEPIQPLATKCRHCKEYLPSGWNARAIPLDSSRSEPSSPTLAQDYRPVSTRVLDTDPPSWTEDDGLTYSCPGCNTPFASSGRKTLLGLRRTQCEHCGSTSLLPMTKAYRIASWIILGGFAMSFVGAWASGRYAIPGLLFVGMAYALYRDHRLRRSFDDT